MTYSYDIGTVRTMLGIEDELQDTILYNIVEMTAQRLTSRLHGRPAVVPDSLLYIVNEVAIARFNRLGSEHLKSDSEEGHTMTWYDNDDYFSPFAADIDAWNMAAAGRVSRYTPGKAVFL